MNGATCALCGARESTRSWNVLKKDGFDIARCPSCTLVFTRFVPSTSELTSLYEDAYFSQSIRDSGGRGYADYIGDEVAHRANARRRLALLERFAPTGSLLDVGCAAGFFLDEATRRGWRARGIDVSPAMSEWGRRELAAEIETGVLASMQVSSGTLDAVTMWDYIEHSTDPAGDLATSARFLRRGGVVALSTGDVESVAARVCGRRWHLLTPPHHLFFFSARTLHRLCAQTGLKVVWLGRPRAVYPLKYLAYKLRTAADIGPVRALARRLDHSRLGSALVPIGLHDIITLVARKQA
jgi:SAM-dependent methyltransferase